MKYQIQNVSIRNIWIACVCKINDVKNSFCCWFQFLFIRTEGYDGGKLDIFGVISRLL